MGESLFILVSCLAVGAASSILLSSRAKIAALGLLGTISALLALETLWGQTPFFLFASLSCLLTLGLLLTAFRDLFESRDGEEFLSGSWVRRAFGVGASWALALILLRSLNRTVPGDLALYWTRFAFSALFGLGLLAIGLRRQGPFVALGVGLLPLGPSLFLSTAGEPALGLLLLAAAVAQVAALLWVLKQLDHVTGSRDTQRWEELKG